MGKSLDPELVARLKLSHVMQFKSEVCCALVHEIGAIETLNTIESVAAGDLSTNLSVNDYAKSVKPYLNMFNLERELTRLERSGVQILAPQSAYWPSSLNNLGTFTPILLYVRGEVDLQSLAEQSVSIVGARNCSEYGAAISHDFSSQLAEKSYTVCSGGAFGIDIQAHRGALNGQGRTVAFIASGVDKITPSGNQRLLERVIQNGGSVVSEYPLEASPVAFRYLERNRLIAAFSSATCVVEAALRSGALSTAHHANALARPVGAVPGKIGSITSSGCHKLIRDHQAVLVTSANDLMELARDDFELAPDEPRDRNELDLRSGEVDAMRLFGKYRLLNAAKLERELVLTSGECTKILVQLQLKGYIKRQGEGYARVSGRR